SNLCLAAGLARDFAALGRDAAALAAVHAAFLLTHLERDLRGNHLLENACALVFAARHLEGRLASRCEATARELLAGEIAEQVLPDGGHFELSPMYHAIVLHRLVQVTALLGSDDALVRKLIAPVIARMARFLEGVLAPAGDIPLIGDSARGFAAHPRHLLELARALESGTPPQDSPVPALPPASAPAAAPRGIARAAVQALPASGLYVLASERLWCIV